MYPNYRCLFHLIVPRHIVPNLSEGLIGRNLTLRKKQRTAAEG